MDEITQNLGVLGLSNSASKDDVRRAFRELAMVWHPDRFAAGSNLQAKAHQKFQAINVAYDFLMQQDWNAGVSAAEPEESPPVEEQVPSAAPTSRKWLWLIPVLAVATIAGAWFYARAQLKRAKTPEISVVVDDARILKSLEQQGDCTVTEVEGGLLIVGEGRLATPDKFSPPCVIDAVAKTDLTNIRLYFGKGTVILNWEMNPTELRYHDPGTGAVQAVPEKGRVIPEQWARIQWIIETNSAIVTVNGEERARFTGQYGKLHEQAGIGPALGSKVTVKSLKVTQNSPQRR